MLDWLKTVQDWLLEVLRAIWADFSEFMQDLVLGFFDIWMSYTLVMWSHIPTPSFLDQYSLCTLLSAAGPTVGWALSTFRIAEALGLIAAGYVFRMVRKLATLFQW